MRGRFIELEKILMKKGFPLSDIISWLESKTKTEDIMKEKKQN
jgi:hypothetical protein